MYQIGDKFHRAEQSFSNSCKLVAGSQYDLKYGADHGDVRKLDGKRCWQRELDSGFRIW